MLVGFLQFYVLHLLVLCRWLIILFRRFENQQLIVPVRKSSRNQPLCSGSFLLLQLGFSFVVILFDSSSRFKLAVYIIFFQVFVLGGNPL